MPERNTVLGMIERKQLPLGIQCFTGDPALIEVVGATGFPDAGRHVAILQELNKKVKQKYAPTPQDLARHPSMHRTDTLDMFVVAYGEIYLVTDTDETLLKPGDTAVVQGVNHAWSNRSTAPCMIVGVMVHANAWPAERYPAPGL